MNYKTIRIKAHQILKEEGIEPCLEYLKKITKGNEFFQEALKEQDLALQTLKENFTQGKISQDLYLLEHYHIRETTRLIVGHIDLKRNRKKITKFQTLIKKTNKAYEKDRYLFPLKAKAYKILDKEGIIPCINYLQNELEDNDPFQDILVLEHVKFNSFKRYPYIEKYPNILKKATLNSQRTVIRFFIENLGIKRSKKNIKMLTSAIKHILY